MNRTGYNSECSRAADRLTKKHVNPEIESDYKRASDENDPKQLDSKFSRSPIYRSHYLFTFLTTTTVSTISTLRTVPFGSEYLREKMISILPVEFFKDQLSNTQSITTSTSTSSKDCSVLGLFDFFCCSLDWDAFQICHQ